MAYEHLQSALANASHAQHFRVLQLSARPAGARPVVSGVDRAQRQAQAAHLRSDCQTTHRHRHASNDRELMDDLTGEFEFSRCWTISRSWRCSNLTRSAPSPTSLVNACLDGCKQRHGTCYAGQRFGSRGHRGAADESKRRAHPGPTRPSVGSRTVEQDTLPKRPTTVKLLPDHSPAAMTHCLSREI